MSMTDSGHCPHNDATGVMWTNTQIVARVVSK